MRTRHRIAALCIAAAASMGQPVLLHAQPVPAQSLMVIPSASAREAGARRLRATDEAARKAATPAATNAATNAAHDAAGNAGVERALGPTPALELPGRSHSMPGDGLSSWYAPVLSAVIPGAGQGMLRQQRGVAYLAAESYLILQALQSNRDALREKREYREIARTVARASVPGERPDGPWSYYERMQRVLESGAYNRTPGAGFTPESDPETFNGSIWLLARETYWRDPATAPESNSAEYQRALSFYQSRAATDEFLWSWRDAQLQQDLFRQTIARSNESSRRTRQMLGLLLANHALSLVDAYVSVRLRVFGTAPATGEGRVGVSGTIPLPSLRR